MGYLLSFRFHPAGEEIINLLNEKGLDPDFSVQTIYKVQTQQLPIHHMTYNFRNHVAENSFSRVEPQQLPNHNLPFDCENHIAENTVQGVRKDASYTPLSMSSIPKCCI
ncbi:hypothetical protein CUMW_040750 [Citrus unshiu]|nr:hypothetical protein CUMW_040750 [Citrus unshiu]